MRLGIIGGGQLAMMLANSAKKRGIYVSCLEPHRQCSASYVADKIYVSKYDDIKELAVNNDILVYEFENVNINEIEKYENVYSTSLPLKIFANRKKEKEFASKLGLQSVPYRVVGNTAELKQFVDEVGYPVVLKSITGGYDGKGQTILREGLNDIYEPMIAEKFINLQKEISIILFHQKNGRVTSLPVGINKHINNILHTTYASTNQSQYKDLVKNLEKNIEATDIFGILAIELFIDTEGKIYFNEGSPRPHNSGHYSIEGCNFSQYDLLIDTIMEKNYPEVKLKENTLMLNILGQHYDVAKKFSLSHQGDTDIHFHDYYKQPKLNRKVAHITFVGDRAIKIGENFISEFYE